MRILQVHNRYSRHGGEDSVIDAEHAILTRHGHEVRQLFASNHDIVNSSGLRAAAAGLNAIWSNRSQRVIADALLHERPDVLHVHNTFASLSPSIYWSAQKHAVPVVLTLHNYRLTCATSVLLRDGVPCEHCVGRVPYPAVIHRCRYAGSLGAGMTIAASQFVHSAIGTYRDKVDAFIALTPFARDIFIRAGIPAAKIHVKPNCVELLVEDVELSTPEPKLLFVGLVDPVKGIDLLLEADRRVLAPHQLKVIGEGPMRMALQKEYPDGPRVRWLGHLARDETLRAIRKSRWLILPSRWYEGFPMVILEALASGRPVIVPDHGGFPSMVEPGVNALLFQPNDVSSLSAALTTALGMPDHEWRSFSDAAIAQYRRDYTPHANYRSLMRIYEGVLPAIRSSAAPLSRTSAYAN